HITEGRRTPVSSPEQRRLLAAFLDAARQGDMAALEGLFAEDVASYSDGGGMVRAARIPVFGRERVARFIAAVSAHFSTGVTLQWADVRGQAAVLMFRDGPRVALSTIDASAQGIDRIMWFMRPSKLAAVPLSGQTVEHPRPPAPVPAERSAIGIVS